MKLRNTCGTLISVGKKVILPDETVEITDKNYENNSAIEHLVEMNCLEIVAEKAEKKPADKKQTGKADKATADAGKKE